MSDKVMYTLQVKKEGGKRWLSAHCWLPKQKPTPYFSVARPIDTLIEILGDYPVLIGLRQQGHIPTVERMLAEDKTWDEIGAAIGWDGKAAHDWYEVERAQTALEVGRGEIRWEFL